MNHSGNQTVNIGSYNNGDVNIKVSAGHVLRLNGSNSGYKGNVYINYDTNDTACGATFIGSTSGPGEIGRAHV